MKRHLHLWILSLAGLAAWACALLIFFSFSALGLAQEAPPAEVDYVGSGECSDCHRTLARDHQDTLHAKALSDDEDTILGDFSVAEELRTVTFPDGKTRPFTADDVAYSLGAGRYNQAYVYEVERGQYRVFPAKWNIVAQQWNALNLDEDWASDAYDFVQHCAACHTVGLDASAGRWEDDAVMCESCHGPGEAHLEAVDEGGRRPDKEELAAIYASIRSGIEADTCTGCHGRASNPSDTMNWHPTGHAARPNMQADEWSQAGHINSLSALQDVENVDEDCLSCHSQDARHTDKLIALIREGEREGEQPERLTIETAQIGIACQTCHNPHSKAEQPFNLVEEAYPLCVSCHSNSAIEEGIHHPVQEMFEGLPLVEGIDGVANAHWNSTDRLECNTCHMPRLPLMEEEGAQLSRASHTFKPVMPAADLPANLTDTCSECHAELASPAALGDLIDDIQADTRLRIDEARALVSADTPAWVSDALNFVEGDGSLGIHNYAYADALLDAVDTALGIVR